MALFTASLNSGSNGNCYYIGNTDAAILVDAGISCRETEKRLKRLGLSMRKIKAIFISHEHGDHIHGVVALSRKYQLPVYISEITMRNCPMELHPERTIFFQKYQSIQIDSIRVTPFPKFHDAADPYSFVAEYAGVTVGVFTDLGKPCDNTIEHFKRCHAAYLESNYDEKMLENGSYPIHLKNRIRGDHGHLSNDQALQLFKKYRPAHMSHVFLSHLSRENNSPKLAKEIFDSHAEHTKVIVASRDRESKLYYIRKNIVSRNSRISIPDESQLILF